MKKTFSLAMILVFILCLIPISSFADTEHHGFTLPDYYTNECPAKGNIYTLYLNPEREVRVWTPFDYNPDKQYELIVLLHGDGNNIEAWLTVSHYYFGASITGENLFNWVAYENKCNPFIVATIDNDANKYRLTLMEDIRDTIKLCADNFSTYARSASDSDIVEARNHITVGGLSRGSILSFQYMTTYPETCGNYICMSGNVARRNLADYFDNKGNVIEKLFVASGLGDDRFYDGCYTCYKYLENHSKQHKFVSYNGGHIWPVWITGIYDALTYLIPKDAPQVSDCGINNRVKSAVKNICINHQQR